MLALTLAAGAFVGSHFALSHPLRAPAVARLGERRFQLFYSVIAVITFGAMIWAYGRVGDQMALWTVGDAGGIAATVLMWFASILLVGSFIGNPALPGARKVSAPSGVLAITRHAMMWSFAMWAVVHLALVATPKALLLDGAILFLALGGSLGQDRKKRRLMGARWHEWAAKTSFVPFGRGFHNPGTVAMVGGTLLFLAATWLHPAPVGIWSWIA